MSMKKKKILLYAVLFLAFGFILGYSVAFITLHPTAKDKLFERDVVHNKMSLSETKTAPSVKVSVTKDNKAGYNVFIDTKNFTFTPENVGKGNIANQGHAHLYVNGKKIARVYGHWHYIPLLEPGRNDIRVTLNANNHDEYAISGQTIGDTVVMNVSEAEHNKIEHTH